MRVIDWLISMLRSSGNWDWSHIQFRPFLDLEPEISSTHVPQQAYSMSCLISLLVVTKMPPMHHRKEVEEITSVAIIGRPNTGKSSLLNAMVGEDRAIVSKIPGTTRDAIDCRAKLFSGEMIKLIDTAGIRRQTAVHGSAEKVK